MNKTEHARLKELRSYCILDTSHESDFDEIAKLVASICETPIATVTLVDKNREWFKSVVGLKERENDRDVAFCAQAIFSNDVFVVPDTLLDPNFSSNPMVTGHPNIRFYAGAPLISPRGHALGALAVKDYQPRNLNPLQLESIRILANQVVAQLESRRQNIILERLSKERDRINQKLTLQTARLEKERDFLSALLENLSEGIVACDDKGKLSLFNHTTRELHGLYEEELPAEQSTDHYDLYLADGKTLMSIEQTPLFRAFKGEKITEEALVIAPKKGAQRFVVCNGQPILSAEGNKLGAVVAMRDITEQKAKDVALTKSEAKFSAIFNQSYLFQGLLDIDGTLTDVNDITLEACGYHRSNEVGKKFWETSWWNRDPQISAYVENSVKKSQSSGQLVHVFTDYHVASGELRQTEFVITPIRGQSEKVVYFLVSGQDVTDRKKSESELVRINRSLRLLSSANELLIRTKNEASLLSELCELIVNVGGYIMAWVGYSYDDPDKTIKPVAHFGDITHLKDIQLSWAEDFAIGKGPAARTIRSGRAVVIPDLLKDSNFLPWADSASSRGFKGVICLPLIHNHHVFGLLAMYTKTVTQVAENEVKLLQELANDLAFGIMNIRAQEESQRFHAAVYKMAASVSATTDEKFFLQLTENVTEVTGADAGFIGQLLNTEPLTVKTLAVIVDSEKIENLEYEVMSTPCRHLLESESFVLSESLTECFNPSETMVALGMKDYIGQRISNNKGEIIGMLFVMNREVAKHNDFAVSLLKVFAARAGTELDRLQSDQHIREQASLLDKAQDAILVRGLDNKVQFWNSGAERLYGWTSEEAVGSLIETLLYPEPSYFYAAMEKLLQNGEWNGEIEQQTKFGQKLTVESHWTLVYDDQGRPQSVFTINTNITDRKAAADKIKTLAFYDLLTNLPNRTLLLDRLKQALSSSERSHQYGALLFIDLDNFKALNDTLGHEMGDLLLKEIGKRLKTCVRESDSVARFGGDEFVVLLENVSASETEAAVLTTKITEKILSTLNQVYNLDGFQHQSSASIGITLFSSQQDSVSELLKRADLAMYQAKAMGRNTLRFFDPQMQSQISARVSLESDLRQSLTKHHFSLHYQPQLNDQGQVVGAEALLRWQHPKRGLVSPAQFIPIAEETRMILPIGHWVLESACATLVKWSKKAETSALFLAVNVSERQFRQPDFVEQVFSVIDHFGANPNRLKLELTESLFAENVKDIIKKMHLLKARGISFSLDDFGTGYSSLSYLKQMPLDQLKIDQSFVRDIMLDPNDASIAKTIISLAHSLDLEVIAEGVETDAQRRFLHENGCNLFQGYLFSKPLPTAQFDDFLNNINATR